MPETTGTKLQECNILTGFLAKAKTTTLRTTAFHQLQLQSHLNKFVSKQRIQIAEPL